MRSGTTLIPDHLYRRRSQIGQPTTTVIVGDYDRFRQVVSAGALIKGNRKAPNPWKFDISLSSFEMNNVTYLGNQTPYPIFDEYFGSYGYTSAGYAFPEYNDEVAAAISSAYSKLIDEIRGNTDVSVDAFQFRQTMRTGHDFQGSIKKILGIVSNPKLAGKLIGPLKGVGSLWLLFQYGIKPTMQTIYDVVKFTEDHYQSYLKVYKGKYKNSIRKTVVVNGWPDYTFKGAVEVQLDVRCIYSVRMAIPDSTLTQAARLTSLNPVSIAWELLPWSFVVDWFFNIGDYLRNLETRTIYGRYFKDGFRTVSYRILCVQKGKRSGFDPGNPGAVWTGECTAYGKYLGSERLILTEFPQVPFPRLSPELGSGRLLNAAALLTNFIKSR